MADSPSPFLSPSVPLGIAIVRQPDGHVTFNQPVTCTDVLMVRSTRRPDAVVEVLATSFLGRKLSFLLNAEQRDLLIEALQHPPRVSG